MTRQQIDAFKKITPGPWWISGLSGRRDNIGIEFSYQDEDGNKHSGSIALLDLRGDKAEADARCIASLPDLLAEREKMINFIRDIGSFANGEGDAGNVIARRCRAMVSEAEGGE